MEIIKIVAKHYNITVDKLLIKTRKQEIKQPRQESMYFYHLFYPKMSFKDIAMLHGFKTHSNALHAIKTINNLMDTDKKYKEEIDELIKICKFRLPNKTTYKSYRQPKFRTTLPKQIDLKYCIRKI